MAYYVLDAEDGVVATITICEDKEKVEESSRVATEWLKQYLASSIVATEELRSFAFEADDPLQGPLYEGVSERRIGLRRHSLVVITRAARDEPHRENPCLRIVLGLAD